MNRPTALSDSDRATTLELFFDLVYVFAFIQVTHLMKADSDASSVLKGLAVLGILWWSWASHAWLANQRAADRGVIRIGILCAIAIVLVLSIAIPYVFPVPGGSHFAPFVFAVGFVFLSIIYAVVNLIASGSDIVFRHQVIRTMTVTIIPVAAALIAGAFFGGPTQLVLWLAAVVIEGATVYLSSRGGAWSLPSAAHFAERHGLVVLLALGESIISIGLGAAHTTLSIAVVGAALLAVFVSLGLWWNYFDRLAPTAEQFIHSISGSSRVSAATFGTYLHLGIVVGVLLVSLGLGDAIERIESHEPFGGFAGTALGAGVSLFFATTAAYGWLTTSEVPWPRLSASIAALAAIPLLATVTPGAALIGAALLPTTLALTESWQVRIRSQGTVG